MGAGRRWWLLAALGLALGQLVLGGIAAATLPDADVRPASAPPVRSGTPVTTGSTTSTTAPVLVADLSTTLADLAPAGYELVPDAEGFGPLDAAGFASMGGLSGAEAGAVASVPGFAAHARLWRAPSGGALVQMVVQVDRPADAEDLEVGARDTARRLPEFAESVAAPDACTYSQVTQGAAVRVGQFRKGVRVYFVVASVLGDVAPPVGEVEALLAVQYAAAP